MPITGPASYLPTTEEFIAHWTAANLALGASGPIVLGGGMTLAGLTALRTTLENQRAQVESERNALEGARADIELRKAALLLRLNQFNGKLNSLSPGSRWETMLPRAFSISEGMGRVIPPLDELEDLWNRYNDENPPITLMGGYGIGDFETGLHALKSAYKAYTSAEIALGLARGKRNETQALIYPVLKQYRQRIPSEFAEGSAVLETLPRLSPAPGSTPDAVELSGSYDVATQQTVLAWSEVTDANVTHLQLRATAGPDYDPEDETSLGNFSTSDAREWKGNFGLLVPGSSASFKLYSLTAEGHEKGSNPVTVTRPG